MLDCNTFFAVQRNLHVCFRVFLILYAYFEHKPKSFFRSWRTRQNFWLIIFGNCAKYREKVFWPALRIRLKHTNIINTENIQPYVENTPIGQKLSLSRRIFDQNQKVSDPKSPFYTLSNRQKNISLYCPFKCSALRTKEVWEDCIHVEYWCQTVGGIDVLLLFNCTILFNSTYFCFRLAKLIGDFSTTGHIFRCISPF